MLAHRRRRVLLVPAARSSSALKGLTERNAARTAGNTFLVNKYYLDDLYEDVIVGGDQGPDRRGVVLGQPERHRRRRQRRRARARRSSAGSRTTYVDQKGVDGAVNGIADGTGEAGGAVRKVQTGRLQFYALAPVRWRSGSSRLVAAGSSRERRGIVLDELVRRLGADPGGLHPGGRACVDHAADPAGRGGRRSRSSRSLTTLATLGVGIGILADFDYDHAAQLQFDVNKPWIDVINSRYHLGDRRHLAAAAGPVDVHHRAVRHLLVEPLPRAAQPEGVPRADPAPRGRHERHVRRRRT